MANETGLARHGRPITGSSGIGISPKRDQKRHTLVKHYGPQQHPNRTWKQQHLQSSESVLSQKRLTTDWSRFEGLPRRVRLPWIEYLDGDVSQTYNVTAHERLLVEIRACQQYLCPTELEKDAATKALQDIVRVLSAIPECRHVDFSLIGSRATGLYGPLSDLDLNLAEPLIGGASEHEPCDVLRVVRKHLRCCTGRGNRQHEFVVRTLRPGRVPVVDCTHLPSGLDIQIQSQDSRSESTEITKAYLAEYPTLDPLFRIVKQMLTMRGLTVGRRGGIASYPLFHMLLASIKLGHSHTSDLASQLLEFLDLYADIDFRKKSIEYAPFLNTPIQPGCEIKGSSFDVAGYDPFSLQPRLASRSEQNPQYVMSLQDPANPENNLGKPVVMIKHVQAVFHEARIQIRKAMMQWDQMYNHGLDMKAHAKPVLEWCLAGNYSHFEEARQTLRAFSQQFVDSPMRGEKP